MDATKLWMVTVEIEEEENTTMANANLRTPAGLEVTGVGKADRNPLDPNIPAIGDELAVARALRNLSERLLHATEKDITSVTGEPSHVHR